MKKEYIDMLLFDVNQKHREFKKLNDLDSLVNLKLAIDNIQYELEKNFEDIEL